MQSFQRPCGTVRVGHLMYVRSSPMSAWKSATQNSYNANCPLDSIPGDLLVAHRLTTIFALRPGFFSSRHKLLLLGRTVLSLTNSQTPRVLWKVKCHHIAVIQQLFVLTGRRLQVRVPPKRAARELARQRKLFKQLQRLRAIFHGARDRHHHLLGCAAAFKNAQAMQTSFRARNSSRAPGNGSCSSVHVA